MKLVFGLVCLFAAPVQAVASGYAIHGTYFDFGPAGLSSAPTSRRVPAVLYVSLRGREAHLRIEAPGARCIPEFGHSHYVGPAHAAGPQDVAAHFEFGGDCFHSSDDARLLLRFLRKKGVPQAVLTDHLRGSGGPVLFQAN